MKRMVFCLVGLVAVLGMAGTSIAGITLTSVTGGDWNDPSTWDDGTLIPTEDYDVVVNHAVNVATDGAASSLFVNGGDLFVEPDNTLSVVGGVQVAGGELGIEGTVNAGSAHVTSALLYLASTGGLNLIGDFLLEDCSEYVCQIGGLTNGLATVKGPVHLNDDNFLHVGVTEELRGWDWGERTIVISETGVDGTFVEPLIPIDCGIPSWLQDVIWSMPYDVSVSYTDYTVDVHYRYCYFNDPNHDGKITDADAAILAANWQRCGVSCDQGDFNGDGCVTDADAAILATHWQDGATPEPSTPIALLSMTGVGLLAWAWRRFRGR